MTIAVGHGVRIAPTCSIYECENAAPKYAKYLTVDGVPLRVPMCHRHRTAFDHRSAIHDQLEAKVGVKADTREKWEASFQESEQEGA